MYKKIKLLVMLFCLLSGSIMAQNIQVLISPKPSPYLSDWQQQTETIKLIITNPTSNDLLVKIRTELFNGKGSLIANTDDSKMPVLTIPPGVSTYNPEDIIPSNAVNYKGGVSEKEIMRTGRIPEDNYQMCVALIDPQSSKPVGSSGTVCKMFNITSYQAPTLISPANKEVIKGAAIKGIVFRWSPVIPSPKTIVTYRFQVWEVLDGQNSMTAMRSNMPIVEKDLKGILQTQWPADFPLPDTGVTYVWTVTPFDDEERKMVDGLGFAEPFEFRVCCIGAIPFPLPEPPPPISLTLPANGAEIKAKNGITFSWIDESDMPKDGYTLRIVELKGDQSPDDAFRTNNPIIEKDLRKTNSFTYQDTDGGLIDGKKYAWAVKGSGEFSKPFVFQYRRDVDHKGRPGSSIALLTPMNHSEVSQDITFTWSDPHETSGDGYTLRIVELKGDQSPDVAIINNSVVYEQKEIKGKSIKFHDSSNKLKKGKKYAWAVKGKEDWSEVWRFSIGTSIDSLVLSIVNDSCLAVSNNQFEHRICFTSRFNSPDCNLNFSNPLSGLKIFDADNTSVQLSYTGLVPPIQPQNLGTGSTVQYCFNVIVPSGVNRLKIVLQGDACPDPNLVRILGAAISFDLKKCGEDKCCPGIWGKFYYGTSTPPKTPFRCGDSINIKCNQKYYLSSSYKCNKPGCEGKVAYKMPASSGASITSTGVFTATANGTYPITIFGICGKDTCEKCVFKFIVNGCVCDPCKDLKLSIGSDLLANTNAAQINLTGVFLGLNNTTINTLTAEIISFEFETLENNGCTGCVFDSKNFGNFISPSSTLIGYSGPVLNRPDYSRLITWNSTVTKKCEDKPSEDIGNPTFNLPIAVPTSNAIKCYKIKVCIRYTFYDNCCKACEIIKCYEITR